MIFAEGGPGGLESGSAGRDGRLFGWWHLWRDAGWHERDVAEFEREAGLGRMA